MHTTNFLQEHEALKQLYRANYLLLTTYKKTGEPVSTPVWFAESDGVLYIATSAQSGKFKRIRKNPLTQVAPCTTQGKVTGNTLASQGRLVTQQQEQQTAEAALRKKYGLSRWVYYLVLTLSQRLRRLPRPEQGYLAIEDIRL
jgi:uncharacterized protein